MTEKTALDLLAERVRHLETLEEIMSNIHGWDGSAWHKLPMVWGYSSRYAETIHLEDAAAGGNLLSGTAVDADEVLVLQALSAKNEDRAPSAILLRVSGGGPYANLLEDQAPVADTYSLWTGELVLHEDDVPQAWIEGCLLNDDLWLQIWGYKMAIAE